MGAGVRARRLDVVMTLVGAVLAVALTVAHPSWAPRDVGTWQWLDLAGGLLAATMVLGHTRAPLIVGYATAAIAATTNPAGGAILAAVFLTGLRRPASQAVWPAAAGALAIPIQYLLRAAQPSMLEMARTLIVAAAITGAIFAWGATLRIRAELLAALADRAERAEASRLLEIKSIRHAERTAIAREMHDVLAHRISQVSMQSGSLAHRKNVGLDEYRDVVETIRSASHRALQDLREILGVLRDPAQSDGGPDLYRAGSSIADLERLIGSFRAEGVEIDVRQRIAQPERLSALSCRTLYRVIEEGLTNAAKHAPGARIALCLTGEPGREVHLKISNRFSATQPDGTTAPGTRVGLIGVRERVSLAGGQTLHSGPIPGNPQARFCLAIKLPWPR